MKERIAHAWAPYSDWPADRSDRDHLASQLFGASLVASIDYWLDVALDQIHHEQSPIWRRQNGGPAQWEADRARRALFQSMTPEQREAVQALVASTLHGAFFSVLADLDQFPAGTPQHECTAADVVVTDETTETTLASVRDGDILELHDRFAAWLDEFSEYPDLFR